MKKTFKIEVDCANCATKIEEAIQKMDFVEKARVNFMSQKLSIEGPEEKMDQLVKDAYNVGKKIDSDFELYM